MADKNIMKGYQGVMDLDLSLIPEQFQKEAVEQHCKDIKEYKIYQSTLPVKLRYETIMPHIEKIWKQELEYTQKRNQKEYDMKTLHYARRRGDMR